MFIVHRTDKDIEAFWEEYWSNVAKDADELLDSSIYPLFPINEYVQPNMRILEAGCGMGRVFKHYFFRGHNIIGLEYSLATLSRLRSENPSFPLVAADGRRLPMADGSMDMIMAFGLVSSIPENRLDFLKEAHRVLKPNGIVCASVVCDSTLRRLQEALSYCSYRISGLSGKPAQRFFFAAAYKPREWRDELARNGFEVMRIEPTHSRVLFWNFLKFLRAKNGEQDLGKQRNCDMGYKLNGPGEFLFSFLRRHIPWTISIGVVGLGRKRT